MMKLTYKFRFGKLLKTHEMPGADILEIGAMRLYNRLQAFRITSHARNPPRQQ
jgi:hypothetical protein